MLKPILCLSLAAALALSACAAIQAPLEPGPPPETARLGKPEDLASFRARPAGAPGRIVYIGVYGGEIPPWERARYFIPKDWPPYQKLASDDELGRIAYHDSLMHVLALWISRLFPDSLALMIKGDSEVVTDVAKYLYAPGDKLYLIGHSQGGAVVADAALALGKAGIPVALLVQMEGFQSSGVVPGNVAQAFNFYVPSTFAICPGRVKLEAEDPAATRVTSVAVPDPWGPFHGACAAHRNIDSDPRVWKPLLEYMIQSAGAEAGPAGAKNRVQRK